MKSSIKRTDFSCQFALIALLLSFFLLLSTSSHALIDPSTKWEVLETEHFEVIYDAELPKLGTHYAQYAETAYQILKPVFKETPKKTIVWVNNTNDISNGSATAIPYPMIIAYPTLPASGHSISSYSHWGQELITHEYTHILQFEPVHGFMKGLQYVFGSIVTPNGVLPRWWLEGMAVETESQFSNGGRLRSNQQQAILRALVLDNKLDKEDISRVNESSIPDWLGGQRPYLLGSLIWNEIVNDNQTKSLFTLAQAHSKRFPFFINQPIDDLYKKKQKESFVEQMTKDPSDQNLIPKGYAAILKKAYVKIKEKTNEQLKIIENKKSNKKTPYFPSLIENKELNTNQSSPEVSVNQKYLTYINYQSDEGKLLKIQDLSSKKLLPTANITPHSRVAWAPNSKNIVFDKLATHNSYYYFSDLYNYNIETKKITQLTFGKRARDPSYSLDGKKIVYIKNLGEKFQLVEMSLDGKQHKKLYSSPTEFRISHPEYIAKNKIVFAKKNRKGNEQLYLLDIEQKKISKILKDYPLSSHPQWTELGLLFISEKTGIANLYLANKDFSSAKALTNSKTAIQSATWQQNNKLLILNELTSNGPQLYKVTNKLFSLNPPVITPTVPYDRKPFKKPSVKIKAKKKEYSALKHLLPRYWIPYVALATDGLFIQASTTSSDPLGKHRYSLLAGYDTGTKKVNSSASYRNQVTAIPITASYLDVYDFFGGGSIRRQTSLSLSGSKPLSFLNPDFNSQWNIGAGWSYRKTESSVQTTSQGPRVSASYNNLIKKGDGFAPTSGKSFSGSLSHFIKSFGTLGYTSLKATGTYYFSKWLPKHHSFSSKLRLVYAPGTENDILSTGVTTASGSFSNSLISSQLLMRGYLPGNFIGQNVLNASFEYLFPLKFSYSGWGTKPIFSRKWHGRLIADVISQDGFAFDQVNSTFKNTKVGDLFTSTGGEIHWNTTIGYHVPFKIFMGFYYGLNSEASGGFQTFLGFSL